MRRTEGCFLGRSLQSVSWIHQNISKINLNPRADETALNSLNMTKTTTRTLAIKSILTNCSHTFLAMCFVLINVFYHSYFHFFSVEWRRPVIKFNSKVVGPEVVVKPGTPLDLRCEGDGPVNWQTRLSKHRRYVSKGNGNIRTLKVERPSAEFTGTYKCVYTQHRELTSSVHVYVKGELGEKRVLLFCVQNRGTSFLMLFCKCLGGSLFTLVVPFCL